MKNKFKAPVAVFLILERVFDGNKQILLQKRINTGYMDNMWDCGASGHVEKGESMKSALVRETKEELDIELQHDRLTFATMSHTLSDMEYVYVYFATDKFKGIPRIVELNKCSNLKWFNVHNMPKDIIPDRKKSIENYINGIYYDEFYW